MMQEER